jgi:hypothetical protein
MGSATRIQHDNYRCKSRGFTLLLSFLESWEGENDEACISLRSLSSFPPACCGRLCGWGPAAVRGTNSGATTAAGPALLGGQYWRESAAGATAGGGQRCSRRIASITDSTASYCRSCSVGRRRGCLFGKKYAFPPGDHFFAGCLSVQPCERSYTSGTCHWWLLLTCINLLQEVVSSLNSNIEVGYPHFKFKCCCILRETSS